MLPLYLELKPIIATSLPEFKRDNLLRDTRDFFTHLSVTIGKKQKDKSDICIFDVLTYSQRNLLCESRLILSTTCDLISFNDQWQPWHLTCAREKIFLIKHTNEHHSIKQAREKYWKKPPYLNYKIPM